MIRVFFLIILAIYSHQLVYALENVNELEWKHRIILVHALAEPEESLHIFEKQDDEIHDRDIYWFIFLDDGIKTNYQGVLQKKFYDKTINSYFKDAEENVVLIGKDGGIKLKEKHLNLQSIFNLIDAMPMRQLEMKKK